MRKFIIAILLLFITDTAYAATVHGTIYDLSLNKVKDTIVKINTVPGQIMVAKDGTYSFNVPNGGYIITANYSNSYIYYTEEEISVKDAGEYVIDLFLFPNFDEENELISDTDISIEDEYFKKKGYGIQIFGITLTVIIIIFIIYFYKKRTKIKKIEKEEVKTEEKEIKSDDYYKKVYEIIKKEKRTTQKEIRKQIPLSEAKISLIITQLEHEGKIQKIKKGRGNIIIFKQ